MGIKNQMKTIEEELAKKQERFDSANVLTRDVIRNSAKAITFAHNDEMEEALRSIEKAREGMQGISKLRGEFAYITSQASQELAEATIFYWIKKMGKVIGPKEAGIDYEQYLLGLMDVVGELKREILLSLKNNNAKSAKLYLTIMEEIYDSTRSIRFAEAVLPYFRKKQDVARIQLESASSDIIRFLKS